MSIYKKYVMPVIVAVTLIGGYNWLTHPEDMNGFLMLTDADLNAIEPAAGPLEQDAGLVAGAHSALEASVDAVSETLTQVQQGVSETIHIHN